MCLVVYVIDAAVDDGVRFCLSQGQWLLAVG